MCVSSLHSPETTDHQTTSANISSKLYIARMHHLQAFHSLFPRYKSVRLILTGICRQERVAYNALCCVFRDNVDSVRILLTLLEDIFLIAQLHCNQSVKAYKLQSK